MSTTEPIAILDFETTGMSPDYGARVTEVGVVVIADGRIVDTFQSLMNAGVRIPRFIEQLTGISNAMIRRAPPAHDVMAELAEFIGELPLVAHNASFDRKFLDAELSYIGRQRRQEMVCSVLVSRRIYPEAPSHKLGELVRYVGLPTDGIYHRALADATMTAQLWLRMQEDINSRYGLNSVPFRLMQALQRVPKRSVAAYFARCASAELL